MELAADATSLLTLSIGNTRVRWAAFHGRELSPGDSVPFDDAEAAVKRALDRTSPDAVVIASVNTPAADAIEAAIAPGDAPIVRIGRDLMPPLQHTLTDASTLGMDRACAALAAFSLVESAVVIVDAGTAITVDFVDGEGVFHGGAIAPGVRMMLRSLHEQTAALPEVEFDPAIASAAAGEPFGKTTAHAMQLGVAAAARGLIRDLVERFAEHYEAYPRVLATGGDAATLFDDDGLVERIVPDLQLIGIQRAFEAAAAAERE